MKECHATFDKLKEKLVTMSILIFPNCNQNFHVHADVSFVTLGIVLLQPRQGVFDHHISFARRNLSKVEKN